MGHGRQPLAQVKERAEVVLADAEDHPQTVGVELQRARELFHELPAQPVADTYEQLLELVNQEDDGAL